MNELIAKHAGGIAGVLSGFDRLVFRGTLRPGNYRLVVQKEVESAAKNYSKQL